MRVSYSRVETFKKCAYQFRLKYIEEWQTLPPDDETSALILGHALHTGIERGVDAAIEEYMNAFPIATDKMVEESIKLEYWIPKVVELLPPDGLHEIEISDDDFIGFIDYLAPTDDPNVFDMYDFKYSNNIDNYLESAQLSLYKYYFEKLNPDKKIRSMAFVFIPKTQIRMKYKNKTNPRDETTFEFRNRIKSELEKKSITISFIDYDPNKVIDFLTNTKHLIEETEFKKTESRLCDWCDYKDYCLNGNDYNIFKEDEQMNLPKNERMPNNTVVRHKMWFYGAPFSGKTYLANMFPDILLLSTDGNYTQLPDGIPPHVDIKNEVTVEGRLTKTKLAWETFKEVIAELEKGGNDFRTIVVDLMEDTYESCRLYMYEKLNITHESDDSYRAWDKVRLEFLSTMKRFFGLNYENLIIISHEDTTSDFTKRSGDKITSIRPNIQPKAALKIAGMVDFVARICNDNGVRILSLKADEVTFGGGRLNITNAEIPCTIDAILDLYGGKITEVKKPTRQGRAAKVEEPVATIVTTTATVDGVVAPIQAIEPPTDEEMSEALPPMLEMNEFATDNLPFDVPTTPAPLETADATPTPTRRRRKTREKEDET